MGFLARVAESCVFDLKDDSMLIAEAHPAGRDEAELQRMRAEVKAWHREVTGGDPSPPPDKAPAAVLDREFHRAMSARDTLACRALAPAPAATRAILDALLRPREADHWFEPNLPGQEGWLRFDLIWAAVERVDDFTELLPAALAVLR